ncbi:MAG: hypothetical protein IKU26_07230 [Clostridia bacterium]|nr:hypothetical protein [Clostridia bacterium]
MENDVYQPKNQMPVSERAKQFAPFSPLNGLSKALRAQERVPQPKPTLCEDQMACLNCQLMALNPGMELDVLFYRNGEVQRVRGIIHAVCNHLCRLTIASQVVCFDELLEIRGMDLEETCNEDFQSD